ncbi:MAG: hypothetical protein KUG81_09855, partial [Gammaproteobacteria bacterium]|nr:hypothetical protein [Gammaproteobacteria bacterium]
MADNTINTRQSYELNGVDSNPPKEWTDIEVNASFENENAQANIQFDSFLFVNNEATVLKDWISSGFPGIYEGVPFKIKGFNNTSGLSIFDGFVNLSDDVSILEDGSVLAKVVKKNGLNTLDERLNALTWGYLEDIGVVGQSNYTTIDYVVQKKINPFEVLMSQIILFLMIKELAEAIKRVSEDAALIAAMTGIPLGGIIGAAIWAVAKALINLIYTIILLIAVINMANNLFELLLPKKRQHKTLKLRTAFQLVAAHLGYTFVSPLTEMDNVYFLPSNPRQDEASLSTGFITVKKGTPTGIPNVLDAGYGVGDFFNRVKDVVYGKFAIIGNELHLRSVNDPFWIKNSTYQMPDVLIEELKYNTDDLKTRFQLAFKIDQKDEWTIDNYKGTAYERVTDAQQVNIQEAKYLSGLNEVNIPFALPTRKDKLNAVENTLKVVAGFIDTLTGVLGGGTNFVSQINSKIGILKVSDNSYSVPKLLYLQGGKLPVNHRDLFSAKVMYDKYWNETSFIANNFKGQRKVYNNVRVPFGLNNFLELIDNSYFTDSLGTVGKVTSINWSPFKDYA